MSRETCKYTVIKSTTRSFINHQKLCDKFNTPTHLNSLPGSCGKYIQFFTVSQNLLSIGCICSVFITFLSTDEFGDFVALLPTTVVEKFAPVEYVEPSCFCCCCILDSCCLYGCWTKKDHLGLDFGFWIYLSMYIPCHLL